jgi:hypothetical protein
MAPLSSHPRTMSRAKDLVIGGLALSTASLVWVAGRQQYEINALTAAAAAAAPVSEVAVRVATATRSTRPIGRSADPAERIERRRETGGEVLDWRGQPMPAAEETERPKRRPDALARLMENPEFVQALGQQRHAMLDARFGPLFRQLNLSGEALAAFKRLLVEKENVLLDVVTVNETAPGGPLSADSLRQGVRLAQAQIDQSIRNSLGPERYGLYQEFERTLAQRATVAQLEQRLSYTGTPLSPAQADSMVRILSATAPLAAAEATPVISILVRDGVPEAVPVLPATAATGRVTDDVIAQAQTVLAPVQVAALREIQSEQAAGVRAAELIRMVTPPSEIPASILPYLLQ